MDDVSYIIKDALRYYDTNKEIFDKISKKFDNFELIKTHRSEYATIKFYDNKQRLLKEYKYQTISYYSPSIKLWKWAWSHPELKKSDTILSRKLLNYALDLDYSSRNLFLKSQLTTSRFNIESDIQIDIHLALFSYLTKQKNIYYIGFNEKGHIKSNTNLKKSECQYIEYFALQELED